MKNITIINIAYQNVQYITCMGKFEGDIAYFLPPVIKVPFTESLNVITL